MISFALSLGRTRAVMVLSSLAFFGIFYDSANYILPCKLIQIANPTTDQALKNEGIPLNDQEH